MVKQISTMGSCSSRNIFYSNINENYKDFFNINFSIEAINLISLMSNPIKFDEKLLNSDNPYNNTCVKHDLSKDFLDFLKEDKIDYLIIDTYFDAKYRLIVVDENSFVSESFRLKSTDFYNTIKDKPIISFSEDYDTFMNLYYNACDSFFKFITENCKNIKIILNCSRSVFSYKDGDDLIENNGLGENLDEEIKYNCFRDHIEEHILQNYDVDVLPFDENTLSDKNHVFGLHPTHYEPRYYKEKTKQINDIITRDDLFNHDSEINYQFRKIKRNIEILKFNLKDSNYPKIQNSC